MTTENLNRDRAFEYSKSMTVPPRGIEYSEMIQSLYDKLPDIYEHLVDDRNLVQETLDESASGSQSEWDLTYVPVNKESILVFVSGVVQTSFELFGQTIIFSVNLPAGVNLTVSYIKES